MSVDKRHGRWYTHIVFPIPQARQYLTRKGGERMKKVLTIALLAAFCAMAFGAVMVVADEGMKTVDAPAEKFPVKKLKAGAKAKPPVTFNHGKHGTDLSCDTCHHTDKGLVAGGETKSCFECHGPEAVTGADGKVQPDTYKMIHDKAVGKCIKCHKTDAKATAAGAPTKCKDCHKK